METLVVLESSDDDKTMDCFLVFVKEELEDRCPDIPCRAERRAATQTLASFSEMAKDVVARASCELTRDTSAERCLYAAFHDVQIMDADNEEIYKTELLLMAFVNRSGSIRRYVMPLFGEETPEEAHRILQTEIRSARKDLPLMDMPKAEQHVADSLATAFLYGCNAAAETVSQPMQ